MRAKHFNYILASSALIIGSRLAYAHSSNEVCWSEAVRPYADLGITENLLKCIAKVESSLNPKAVNRSHIAKTNSVDYGLTQINSRNLRKGTLLHSLGFNEENIMEPCVNAKAGATLLADLVKREGLNWETIGKYNAACTKLKGAECREARESYAWKVYRACSTGHIQKTNTIANHKTVVVLDLGDEQ